MSIRYGWIIVFLCGILPGTAQAEWPNLNPFSNSPSPVTNSGDAWYPGKYIGSAVKSTTTALTPKPQNSFGQPSTMTRMWNGTKEAMYDTADFLNPWYSRPKYRGPFSPTGSSTDFNNRAPVKTKVSDSTPWWAPYDYEDEPKNPTTVNEFLQQSRPGFDD